MARKQANLKVLRVAKNLTLMEASEQIGIGIGTLSDMERRSRKPQDATIERVANYYGVTSKAIKAWIKAR